MVTLLATASVRCRRLKMCLSKSRLNLLSEIEAIIKSLSDTGLEAHFLRVLSHVGMKGNERAEMKTASAIDKKITEICK